MYNDVSREWVCLCNPETKDEAGECVLIDLSDGPSCGICEAIEQTHERQGIDYLIRLVHKVKEVKVLLTEFGLTGFGNICFCGYASRQKWM